MGQIAKRFPPSFNRQKLIVFASLAVVFIALSANSNGRATQGNRGNTGAAGENNCAQCHGGSNYGAVNVQIQCFEQGTNLPVSAYLAGATYDMRVTLTHGSGNPVGFGFQLTALTAATNAPLMGYSNLASNVKQITLNSGPQAGRTYVEHNGVTSNNQFNFSWTAPGEGTGTVNFFSSGNAVNGNGGSSGDSSGAGTLTLPEAQPLSVSATATSPSCFGAADGSIFISINSGVPPYSYNWSDGATDESRTGLIAGLYAVIITDAAGQSFQDEFTLTEPSPIITSVETTDALIPDGIGTVDLSASAGAGNYTFEIDGVGVVDSFPLELTAGTYGFTVTDANGCSVADAFTIGAPAALTVDAIVTSVSCFGETDGSIAVSNISGATPPYTVEWDVDESSLDALEPGTYHLTVTDAVGYALTFSFDVVEPALLEADGTLTPIACFGDLAEFTITATGGTLPYTGTGTELLEPGGYAFVVVDANGCSTEVNVEVTGPQPLVVTADSPEIPCEGGEGSIVITAEGGTLPYTGTGTFDVTTAGIYPFTVTDANGCSTTIEAVVNSSDGFSVSATVLQQQCFDSCDGVIELNLIGAEEPVSAAWSNGSDDVVATNLCAGLYTVTLNDANGCVLQASYTIQAIPELLTELSVGTIACSGGATTADLVVTGGTPSYLIEWLNDEGEVNPDGLPAGFYTATATDANGCAVSIDFELTEPDPIEVELLELVDITDAPGSITVSAVGGTPPYAYTWNVGAEGELLTGITEPGSFSVTVTDGNGCEGAGGPYEVLVNAVGSIDAESFILSPNPFSAQLIVSADSAIERIQVLSMNGQRICDVQPLTNRHVLAAEDWPAGAYVIVATFAEGVTIRKALRH